MAENYEEWKQDMEVDLMMQFHEKQRESERVDGSNYDFRDFLSYALESARETGDILGEEYIITYRDELLAKYYTKREQIEIPEEIEESEEVNLTSLRDNTEEKERELLELEKELVFAQQVLSRIEAKCKALQKKISIKKGLGR